MSTLYIILLIFSVWLIWVLFDLFREVQERWLTKVYYRWWKWSKTPTRRRIMKELLILCGPCLLTHFVCDYYCGNFYFANGLAYFSEFTYLYFTIYFTSLNDSLAYRDLFVNIRDSWLRKILPGYIMGYDEYTAKLLIQLIIIACAIIGNGLHYLVMGSFSFGPI
jgi:hypothetical protein